MNVDTIFFAFLYLSSFYRDGLFFLNSSQHVLLHSIQLLVAGTLTLILDGIFYILFYVWMHIFRSVCNI